MEKWHPFKKQNNFLSGLWLLQVFRWWPNVASTLNNDGYSTINKITDQLKYTKP